MTKIEALEREVEKLTREGLAAFREWISSTTGRLGTANSNRMLPAGKLDRWRWSSRRIQVWQDEGNLSHQAGSRFWRHFEALPAEIQQLARENFELCVKAAR